MSTGLGNKKMFRMPSGKHIVHSVSSRHNDDRGRNAPGIFRKVSDSFFISDLYRHLMEIAGVNLTPVTLIDYLRLF